MGGLEDFRMKYGIRTLMMGKELIGTGEVARACCGSL